MSSGELLCKKPGTRPRVSSERRFLYASTLLSLGVLAAIACNAPPFNGTPSDMLEFVRHHTLGRNWATVLVAMLLFWLAAKASALLRGDPGSATHGRSVAIIVGLVLTGLVLQLQVQRLRTAGWLHWESEWTVGQLPATGLGASAFLIVDDWYGGYLNEGYSVGDASWLLENYNYETTLRRSFHTHLHNKPPGGVLLMHALISTVEALPDSFLRFSHRALENFSGLKTAVQVLQRESGIRFPAYSRLSVEQETSRQLAYPLVVVLVVVLLTVALTFTAIPLFFLARELLGNEEQALWVSIFWFCLPGPLLLSPTWDQLYPILSTSILLTAVWSRWLPSHLGPIFVGMLLALSLMFTPLFVSIIPVCAVLVVWPPGENAAGQWRTLATRCGLAMLGIVGSATGALYLLKLVTGFNYISNLHEIYGTAGFGIHLEHPLDQWQTMWSRSDRWSRPYLGAIVFNQYEFVLALGLVPFTCALYQTLGAGRRVLGQWKRIARIDLFVLGTTGALLFVSVSGRMDFEVCRLGLPLFPSVLIATVCFLRTAVPDPRSCRLVLMALGIVQVVWVMVVREFMILS
jgi:hypothetical protein